MEDDFRLPLLGTLKAACEEILDTKWALARATLLPLGLLALAALAPHPSEFARAASDVAREKVITLSVFAALAGIVANALMTLSCCRIILLGPEYGRVPWRVGWMFFSRSLWMMAILLIPAMSAAIVSAVLRADFGEQDSLHFVGAWGAVSYLVARLSLVFPACAIEERIRLGGSWRRSAGNGWRLAAVLQAGPLALLALDFPLGKLPFVDHVAFRAVDVLVRCSAGLFEAACLAVSYRALVGDSREEDGDGPEEDNLGETAPDAT